MALLNDFNKAGEVNKAEFKTFIQLLYPVAPHMTEELWEIAGFEGTLHDSSWPVYDEAKTVDDVIEMAVQINGKVRAKITLPSDADAQRAREIAMENENIQAYTNGKKVVKEIYIPGKIFNIVVK